MNTKALSLGWGVIFLLFFCVFNVVAQTPVPDNFNPGANGWVYCVGFQPDGKVLVGGDFSTLGGQTCTCLGRLNPDGTLDTSFKPQVDRTVYSLALQRDGSLWVAGTFTNLGGVGQSYIGRLNADGTLDTSFAVHLNSEVLCLAIQADGKILVGGSFYTTNGQGQDGLARLNPDGTLDSGFYVRAAGVRTIALQPDQKILVGGSFSGLGFQTRQNLGRLNPDGSVDSAFNPGADNFVNALLVQPDGEILVGGYFTVLGGQKRNRIGRLNPDGTVDPSLSSGVNSMVTSFGLQTDGAALVGMRSSTVFGAANVSRFKADGAADTNFNANVAFGVQTLAVQGDGKILVGGVFTNMNNQARLNIARWNNTGPADQSLDYTGGVVTWQRSGTSPELSKVFFDFSTNGVDWAILGEGTRIATGWRFNYSNSVESGTLRCWGFVTGGGASSSAAIVEAGLGRAALAGSLYNQTNNAGTTATFSMAAIGSGPLSFQWLKDGAPLLNSSNVTGATTSILSLSNVVKADEGGFSLMVSNSLGSVTSTVASLTVIEPIISVQPVSQYKNAGESVILSAVANGTAPLAYQWWRNGSAVSGAASNSLSLSSLRAADAGTYFLVVSNNYGCVTSIVANLTVNLAMTDSTMGLGANSSVHAFAVQADGKIVVGGAFSRFGGQMQSNVVRLNPSGSLDTNFNPRADRVIEGLWTQPDGKVLLSGFFNNLGGQPRQYLGRVYPDGQLDTSFQASVTPFPYTIVLQGDGKILVGGSFTNLSGTPRKNLGRLLPDGTLDAAFNPDVDGVVASLGLLPDGKILVGGSFTNIGGGMHPFLARLNPDGTVDSSFFSGLNGYINAMAVREDGKIVAGGSFTFPGEQGQTHLGLINQDGTLDTNFQARADDSVFSLAAQADGKVIVAGDFSKLGGQLRSRIGRLNPDGSVDDTFNPGASGTVAAVALQADGKILAGGSFRTLGGQAITNIGRLNNTEGGSQRVELNGPTATWLRSGALPEVYQAYIEISTNNLTWTKVGEGTRIPGGWQCTGVNFSTNTWLRWRGSTAGGYYSGSGGLVESYYGKPIINGYTSNATVNANSSVIFSTLAIGSEPLFYQWYKDGVAVTDTGGIRGAQEATLSMSNVFGANSGNYWVVVSNRFGSVTNMVASLAVREPLISGQPVTQRTNFGGGALLSVGIVGTQPVSYQWWKDGVEIAGAITNQLVFPHLTGEETGKYFVIARNAYGSVTSVVVQIDVNLALPDASFTSIVAGFEYPEVYALAVQLDSKILLGGNFYGLGGQSRMNLGRVNADGSLDTNFNVAVVGSVRSLVVEENQKILVGGSFTRIGGQARNNIARLNSDGSVDPTFNPGATGNVAAILQQADGKILVGGGFTNLGGETRFYIGRLNQDGTIDSGFNSAVAGAGVSCLAVQIDGKILIGGNLSGLSGQDRNDLGRLNPDGTIDPDFKVVANNIVRCLAVQPDGKIVVGGAFTNLWGVPRRYLGRLHSDGRLDEGFNASTAGNVFSIVLQADGKILVGGEFDHVGDDVRFFLARLNADGSVDKTFSAGASASVYALALQKNGEILVGGRFERLAWANTRGLGRLLNTLPPTENLDYDGSTITWLRGGSGPEVWRTVFDFSPDGQAWNRLGEGTRSPQGWRLTGVTMTNSGTLRARGYVSGGYQNGSGGFVDTLAGPPRLSLEHHGLTIGLSWPGFAGSVDLFSTTNLAPPVNWERLMPAGASNGQFHLELSATNPGSFFQLRPVR